MVTMDTSKSVSGKSSCTIGSDGLRVCTDVICTPPLLWRCTSEGQCSCQAATQIPTARASMACEVRILYTVADPAAPQVAPMGEWCDAAGVELAVAVILAKLLGAR